MASDCDRPREGFDPVGMLRYGGLVLLILAAVLGYFELHSWAHVPANNHPTTLPGALGALLLTAALPLLVLMIARIWRDRTYSRLETYAAQLYDLLHTRSSEYSRQGIVHEMILLYGRANSVGGRIGFVLAIALSALIMACALYMDRLVHVHMFTRNQANLLIVFMMISSFAFWCLLWPQRHSRADQLDPSGVFASAMGR